MNSIVKQIAWLFLLLVTLTYSGWHFIHSKAQLTLDSKMLAKTVDTVINDLTVRQYNAQGQLIHALKTPLLHHIPLNNTHWLQSPYIRVIQENQAPWEIQAKEAISSLGGKEIVFNKQVVIHQKNPQSEEETTLQTESITYYPKKELAYTNEEVIFQQPGSIVQSKGMRAYLNEKRVQLLSQARGTYEPSHS